MNYKLIYSVMLLIISCTSCVYPYDPDISKYENLLVVDGELTNLPGPYLVKLTRTYADYQRKGKAVCGAQLKFIENTGREIKLSETDNGVYATTDSSFVGIVGNSYKLQIVLDDVTYESDFETIKKPIPIEQIYWQYNTNENGVNLLVDAHDPINNTHFYAWDYEETWKFEVPLTNFYEHPEWKVCYKYANNVKIDIASTANRKNDIVKGHSLKFISEETNRLYYRYTILVKQFSLSESAYKYFKDLANLNYNQGTLFDPIPGPVTGNINNLSEEDAPILGYFLVSGVSEKRLFIDRSELPDDYYPTSGFDDCENHEFVFSSVPANYTTEDFRELNSEIDSLIGEENFSIYKIEAIPFYGTVVSLAKTRCYNCALSGTTIVPEFWVEKED